jgi:hypothetical protein
LAFLLFVEQFKAQLWCFATCLQAKLLITNNELCIVQRATAHSKTGIFVVMVKPKPLHLTLLLAGLGDVLLPCHIPYALHTYPETYR